MFNQTKRANDTEIWRDIEGFEGLYQVSNKGKVKRLKGYQCKKERELKNKQDKYGYHYVILSKEGKAKTLKMHRIVAKEFIPNLDNKPLINHIDGIKTNNHASNLEWCTSSENIKHAFDKGLNTNYGRNAKLTNRDVVEIRKLYATGEYIQKKLAEMFGCSKSQIGAITTYTSRKNIV